MSKPTLPDVVPNQIDSMDAYRLIAEHGVASVDEHPACERITLNDGSKLTIWHGGGWMEVPTYWTLEP